MTAGRPLASRPAVRPAMARPGEAAAARVPPLLLPVAARDDEFRLNLRDLPRASTGLQVDGFAPSLFSRLLDLIDRLRGRP